MKFPLLKIGWIILLVVSLFITSFGLYIYSLSKQPERETEDLSSVLEVGVCLGRETHTWFGSDRNGKCLPKTYRSERIPTVKDRLVARTTVSHVEYPLRDSQTTTVRIFFNGYTEYYIYYQDKLFLDYRPNDTVLITIVERVTNLHIFDTSGNLAYIIGGISSVKYVERVEKG